MNLRMAKVLCLNASTDTSLAFLFSFYDSYSSCFTLAKIGLRLSDKLTNGSDLHFQYVLVTPNHCSRLSERKDRRCIGGTEDCHVLLPRRKICYCHDDCFHANLNCCRDICKFYIFFQSIAVRCKYRSGLALNDVNCSSLFFLSLWYN